MPRINAASIDEHVRHQTQRITNAARRVFAIRGFGAADLGSIAAEVGLARNSLYRYFANKDEILLACIREDMEPHIAKLAALADKYPDPAERIVALVNMQFDFATGPEHATLELINEVREGSAALRKEIAQLHREPNSLLEKALIEVHGVDRDSSTVAAMVGGMLMAATARAVRDKLQNYEPVRAELLKSVRAVLAV
jgi:AcrR family transcriptional regulator